MFASAAQSGQVSLLRSFGGSTGPGWAPYGEVVQVGSTLFGTLSNNGDGGHVYAIDTDGSNYRLLHSFVNLGDSNDGSGPFDGLVTDGARLFGTTWAGGPRLRGTVFSLNLDGSDYRIIQDFQSPFDVRIPNGKSPQSGLTWVGSRLFGTTRTGGTTNNTGIVYSMNPDGSDYRVLHRFVGGTGDGATPLGRVAFDGSKIYGTTQTGGAYNKGIIYSMNPTTGLIQIVHSFGAPGTDSSYGTELTISGSTIFGMSQSSSRERLFAIEKDGSNFRTLHQFNSFPGDGYGPNTPLTIVGSTLVGTTVIDNLNSFGVVFSINMDGTNYRILHSFLGGPSDGGHPRGTLTIDGNRYYGTTTDGGLASLGTVFVLTVPEPSSFVILALCLCAYPLIARSRANRCGRDSYSR